MSNFIEKLNKTEEEWRSKLTEEERSEEEINSLRDIISNKLINNNNRTKINVFNKNFDIGLIINTSFTPTRAKMIVTDIVRFEIARDKYKPMFIDAEFDDNYSVKGNIAGMVEAWLRHITGTIKPEMEEEKTEDLLIKR